MQAKFLTTPIDRRDLLRVGGGLIAGSLIVPKWAVAAPLKPEQALNLYNVNTGEFFKEVIWAGGGYVQENLTKVYSFLRDWRTGQEIKINHELLSLLYRLGEKVDAKKPFEIFCGYRSPKTNAQLRKRNKGVARRSRHMTGDAVDFKIPGVRLRHLRNAATAEKVGGVGYYPKSGFVHVDIRERFTTW
ncbi:MAG: YcbK family protein [Pseudomonadota bacterium]